MVGICRYIHSYLWDRLGFAKFQSIFVFQLRGAHSSLVINWFECKWLTGWWNKNEYINIVLPSSKPLSNYSFQPDQLQSIKVYFFHLSMFKYWSITSGKNTLWYFATQPIQINRLVMASKPMVERCYIQFHFHDPVCALQITDCLIKYKSIYQYNVAIMKAIVKLFIQPDMLQSIKVYSFHLL